MMIIYLTVNIEKLHLLQCPEVCSINQSIACSRKSSQATVGQKYILTRIKFVKNYIFSLQLLYNFQDICFIFKNLEVTKIKMSDPFKSSYF